MAISKNLLCCEAKAFKVTGLDADRAPTYDEGAILNRVYVTQTLASRNGNNGAESNDTMKLYFDAVNSAPAGYEFEKGQKIEFNGKAFTVNSIAPYYNAGGLHHYEIGLV